MAQFSFSLVVVRSNRMRQANKKSIFINQQSFLEFPQFFGVKLMKLPDFNRQAAFIVLGAFLAITSCSSNESMLNSVLLPSVSRHLFVIWSLTSLKCLYNS